MKRLSHLLGLVDVVSELFAGRRIQQESEPIILQSHATNLRTILADGFFAAKLNEIITRGGQSSRIKKEVQ